MADETRGERVNRLTGAIRGSANGRRQAVKEIAGMATIEALYCLSVVCGRLCDRPREIAELTDEIGLLLTPPRASAGRVYEEEGARDNTGVISEGRRA